MRHIDEVRLESDLAYRFGYLAEFMGFDDRDVAAIHGAAPRVALLVPSVGRRGLREAHRRMTPPGGTSCHRQSGIRRRRARQRQRILTMDHAQIQFRKEHLGRYLVALVTRPYDGKMVMYLDMVGKMHTPKAGSSALDVPLVQMNALLGFVADALTVTILSLLQLDRETGDPAPSARFPEAPLAPERPDQPPLSGGSGTGWGGLIRISALFPSPGRSRAARRGQSRAFGEAG